MASASKVRISLRSDDLSNWESKNPVLNNGELAIVRDTNGNARFKIGDGTTAFKSLSYVNENELETNSAVVKSLAQGLKTKATPLGFAAGAFLSANANFSQALGYNAETKPDDSYAFVWNGDAERALFDYYQSHGPGTFNINPADGLSGAYVGEQSLAEILGTKQDTLSTDSDGNIYVAVAKADGKINRSSIQLSALETVTANVRPTYYVEFDSPLVYGSLFPVKYKDIDPYDGYWEFYQTYEQRNGQYNGTIDLIEVKDQGGVLCCYFKSSPTSQVSIEGDVLSAENLTWSEFEVAKHYEFTMLGYPCAMDLKTYYDANGYSRASINKQFVQNFQLSNYYDKTETSSASEIANTIQAIPLSDYAKISVDNEAVQDFKILHISYDEYAQLINAEEVDPHTVYVLSANGHDDQFGNRVINLGFPISADDAANKQYVDNSISAAPFVPISSDIQSTISSDVGITGMLRVGGLEVHSDLSYRRGQKLQASCMLQNRTFNYIYLSSGYEATPYVFEAPALIDDQTVRDFLVRIKIVQGEGSMVPTISFAGLGDVLPEGDEYPTWEIGGVYDLSFTEQPDGTWLLKVLDLTPAA